MVVNSLWRVAQLVNGGETLSKYITDHGFKLRLPTSLNHRVQKKKPPSIGVLGGEFHVGPTRVVSTQLLPK